jgi:uncharacterized protein
LLRVVAVGGAIVADPAARRPGRGAYLHLSLDCWERARRRRALPRALRAAGPLADEGLVSYLRAVAGTVDQPVDDAGTGGQYGGDDEDKDERSMSKRR